MQDQGDEEPSHAPVAIQKRVDGFELHVRERRLDERPRGVRRVQVALQRAHAGFDFLRRRGHELGVARPGAAEPVLAGAKFAGLLGRAAPARQQPGVDFAQQPVAQRKAFAQARQAVFQRGDVVGDLGDVVERYAGRLVELEHQQIGQRGLCAFDLAGEHGLAPHVGVEEKIGLGQQRGDGIQPSAGEQRTFEQALARTGQLDGGCRRQGRRHKGAYRLARHGGGGVCSRGSALHRWPP